MKVTMWLGVAAVSSFPTADPVELLGRREGDEPRQGCIMFFQTFILSAGPGTQDWLSQRYLKWVRKRMNEWP